MDNTILLLSLIREINDIKQKFENELRNSMNQRSCEESKSELSNGNDRLHEESQQSGLIWENNKICDGHNK